MQGEFCLRTITIMALAAIILVGCTGSRLERNTATGAAIGAGAGAIAGAAATGAPQGAGVGAAVGAVAGGVIGSALAPSGRCYARTKKGRLVRIRCP
jgi:uncharacterized protein YcfJ